jgi:hypothetical protein
LTVRAVLPGDPLTCFHRVASRAQRAGRGREGPPAARFESGDPSEWAPVSPDALPRNAWLTDGLFRISLVLDLIRAVLGWAAMGQPETPWTPGADHQCPSTVRRRFATLPRRRLHPAAGVSRHVLAHGGSARRCADGRVGGGPLGDVAVTRFGRGCRRDRMGVTWTWTSRSARSTS